MKILTGRSRIHGKGGFAARDLTAGERIIEYKGRVITWAAAQRQKPHNPKDPNHTFLFHVDDRHVIDASHEGNAARWINHSCAPNCEAEDEGGRIFIKALRNIKKGTELFYDYGLVLNERHTARNKAQYPCHCGARQCRGTLLGKKR